MSDPSSASPYADPHRSDARPGPGPSSGPSSGPSPDAATGVNQALLRELLNRLAYLQDFTSADELGYYLSGIERRTAARGQRLYAQGDHVDRIILVLSGSVDEVRTRPTSGLATDAAAEAAPRQDEFLLRRAGPPTLLGLFDLVNGKPHSSSAQTATECDLIILEATQVNRLLYRYPELRTSMLPAARIDRLRTMPLLAGADNVAISYVADAAAVRTYIAGDTIYQAGESADRIFLIDEGQVRLDYGDANKAHSLWMGNGGDLGYGARPLAATRVAWDLDHNAVAVSSVRLLVLPRQTFVAATGILPEVEGARLRTLRAETLERMGVFGAWSSAERSRLLGFLSHYFLPGSHLLTQQGDVADSLWVLLPGGRAVVHTVGSTGVALADVQLEGPGYFNEDALRSRIPAASTLEAEPGSSWLRLHWQDFNIFLEQTGRQELAAQLRLNRRKATVAVEGAHKRLRWLAADEHVLLEVRRHWIVAMAKIAPAALLTVILGWLLIFLAGWGALSVLAWIGVGALGVLTLAAWLWGVADYLNDYLIVTDLRVVRQEKVVLLRQSMQAAPLEKIQDVNMRQDAWGVYLGFADLEVQTPGPGGNIRFDRVANSERVAQQIRQARDARHRHYQATGKKRIYQVLEDRFGGTLVLPPRVLAPAPKPAADVGAAPAPAGFVWLARLTGGAARPNPLTGHTRVAAAGNAASAGAAARAASQGERHVWHKHWLVLVTAAALPLLALIAAISLGLFFYIRQMGGALVSMSIFFALAAAGWLWWNVEDWYNDVYILEQDQLMDVERSPLGLARQQRTAGMRQIVDLRLDVPSPLHYLLNFGNVFVQTAAQDGEFTFLNVRDPAGVMETIRRRLDESRMEEEQQAAKQRAQEFPDWLEVYSRLERRREADSDFNAGEGPGASRGG